MLTYLLIYAISGVIVAAAAKALRLRSFIEDIEDHSVKDAVIFYVLMAVLWPFVAAILVLVVSVFTIDAYRNRKRQV